MNFTNFKDKVIKTFSRKNIVQFMDKQGFYIVLFICICIIGITALWTSGRNAEIDGEPETSIEENDVVDGEDTEKPEENSDKIDIKVGDVDVEDIEENDEEEIQEKGSIDGEDTKPETGTTTEEQESEPLDERDIEPVSTKKETTAVIMENPVEGDVLLEFSMEDLVYSKTLKEWTTHSGMDIKGSLGAEVKAALGGTIEKVEEDPLMGIIITIDHGNGLKTRYANLSTKDMVEEGQKT